MPAYLIGQISVKDSELWRQYVAGVGESLYPFDAVTLFRGKRVADFAGEQDKGLVVVIEFKDQETLNEWFNSKAYQSLIPLRDQAAEVVITAYENYG